MAATRTSLLSHGWPILGGTRETGASDDGTNRRYPRVQMTGSRWAKQGRLFGPADALALPCAQFFVVELPPPGTTRVRASHRTRPTQFQKDATQLTLLHDPVGDLRLVELPVLEVPLEGVAHVGGHIAIVLFARCCSSLSTIRSTTDRKQRPRDTVRDSWIAENTNNGDGLFSGIPST
jgi:hypothetical protein